MLRFDHYKFWQKRMRLVDIDPDRLGRLIRNRVNGTRSRVPEIGMFGRVMINLDRKKGGVILRAYGTIQEVIDEVGSSFRLNRVLTPIMNDMFLPEPVDLLVRRDGV